MDAAKRAGRLGKRNAWAKVSFLALSTLILMPGTSWSQVVDDVRVVQPEDQNQCASCLIWRDDHIRVTSASGEHPNIELDVRHKCQNGAGLEYSWNQEAWEAVVFDNSDGAWRGGVVKVSFNSFNVLPGHFDTTLYVRSSCGSSEHDAAIDLCVDYREVGRDYWEDRRNTHAGVATVGSGPPEPPFSNYIFVGGFSEYSVGSHDISTLFKVGFERDLKGRVGIQAAANFGEDVIPAPVLLPSPHLSNRSIETKQDVLLADILLGYSLYEKCDVKVLALLGGSYSDVDVDTRQYSKGWGALAGIAFRIPTTYRTFVGADIKGRYQFERDSNRTRLEGSVFFGFRF